MTCPTSNIKILINVTVRQMSKLNRNSLLNISARTYIKYAESIHK